LAAALDHLASEFNGNTSIVTLFASEGITDGLHEVGNTVLFRIAQEALTNIKRHANAKNVKICLTGNKSNVTLAITDDGVGFDLAGISQHPKRGIGLRNMHERVDAIGGKLELTSSPDGTHVRVTLSRT